MCNTVPPCDDCVLRAWRSFYPEWRDPLPPKNGYDATMDAITLVALRRVLEGDRKRVAERS